MAVCITALLTQAALRIPVAAYMPVVDYTTWLDTFQFWSFVWSTLGLLEYILVNFFIKRREKVQQHSIQRSSTVYTHCSFTQLGVLLMLLSGGALRCISAKMLLGPHERRRANGNLCRLQGQAQVHCSHNRRAGG